MDNATRHCLSLYLNEITERYNAEKARLDQLDSYLTQKLKTRRERGCIYYYVLVPDKASYRYLGTGSNEEVKRIKEARHLQLSVRELGREIRLISDLLRFSRDISYDAIEQKLSNAYRNAAANPSHGMDIMAKR